MKIDIRSDAAKFYDYNPGVPRDVPFYQALIASPQATILELGCGTGRVTLQLAPHCGFIYGIDRSSAMIAICREKLARANIPAEKASVAEGDITDFDLGQRFDLIIAPFRVIQNLETDAQLDELFHCIGKHLAPGGTCILNAFRPKYPPDEMRQRWVTPEEQLDWEVAIEGGKVACYDRRQRLDPQTLALYPDLIYRRYQGEAVAEEIVLHLVMRCHYPDSFEKLIVDHGFHIVNRWGGYEGEAYGDGPELVIQFQAL